MKPRTSWVVPAPQVKVEALSTLQARERLKRAKLEFVEKLAEKAQEVALLNSQLSDKAEAVGKVESLLAETREASAARILELEKSLARLTESAEAAQKALEKLKGSFSSVADIVDNYARAYGKIQKAAQLATLNGDEKKQFTDKRKQLRERLLDTLSKTVELKAKD